jgi:hypothetical protein
METFHSSEIPTLIYQTIRSHTPEDGNIDTRSCEKYFTSQSTVVQLLKKSHDFYGSRRFISVYKIHFNRKLSSHLPLGLPGGPLPSRYPNRIVYTFSPLPCVSHATSSHHSRPYRFITVSEKKCSEEGALLLHATSSSETQVYFQRR